MFLASQSWPIQDFSPSAETFSPLPKPGEFNPLNPIDRFYSICLDVIQKSLHESLMKQPQGTSPIRERISLHST